MSPEPPPGLGRRLGARAVDVVVLLWLGVIVLVELDQRLFGGDPLGQRPVRLDLASARSILLVLILVVVYEVVPGLLWGATPGKAVLGLRVRLVADLPPVVAVAGRAAVLYLPLILLGPVGLVVPVVLIVSIVVAGDGRGLHDRLVGTIVVSPAREEDR